MIRPLLAIIFAASGTLAGVNFGITQREADTARRTKAAATHSPEESVYLTPDIFTSSVIRGKDQLGFAIFRFALETDMSVKNPAGITDEVILADALNSVAFNSDLFSGGKDKTPDMSSLTDEMLALSNQVTGGKRFRQALILQFDLFSRTEVRKKIVEERILSDDKPVAKPKGAEH